MPLTGDAKREYDRQRIAAARAAYFNGKACVKCGSRERLELHHRDPKKKRSHNIWSWTPRKRAAELRKCDPLCHNCHLAETRKQRRAHIKHPSYSAYDALGCRCADCRRASAEYRAELRARSGANG